MSDEELDESLDDVEVDYEAMFKVFELEDSRLWHYRAVIARVYDGDTVVAVIDKGFMNLQLESLRLVGINTPELRPRKAGRTEEDIEDEKRRAVLARDRVKELVEGKQCVIKTHKAGKYGRWLAEVYIPGDPQGRTVNQVLVEEGHAVPYMV